MQRDIEGVELPDALAAKEEATRAMADYAADTLPKDGAHREIGIEVRDEFDRPIFNSQLEFSVRQQSAKA